MANIKSAKKRAIQGEKKHQINLARKSEVRTTVKKVLTAMENNAAVETVKDLMKEAETKLARAKNKIMHSNTASRKISRLAQRVADYTETKQAAK